MVRVYRSYLIKLLMIVHALREKGIDPDVLCKEVFTQYNNRQLPGWLSNLVYTVLTDPPGNWDELEADCREALALSLNPPERGMSLIDTIIHILRLPFGGARFGANIIQSLGRALMLPSEWSKVQELVDKHELFCGSCHNKFEHGEAIVLLTNLGPGESPMPYCSGCANIEKIRCKCHRTPIDMPAKLAKVLHSLSCQEEKEAVAPKAPEAPAAGGIGLEVDAGIRRARAAARAFAMAPPHGRER